MSEVLLKTSLAGKVRNLCHFKSEVFPELTEEQLEHQEKALQAAFGILKGRGIYAADDVSLDKRPLTPAIIARLGPHRKGIIAASVPSKIKACSLKMAWRTSLRCVPNGTSSVR